MRKLLTTRAAAQDLAGAVWSLYYSEEVEARGLRDGDSLDVDASTGLPVPAVTTMYVEPREVEGGSEVLVTPRMEAWQGRAVMVGDRRITVDVLASRAVGGRR